MEEWEREYITQHLPKLMKVTTYRESLLIQLRAKGPIGDSDVDDLKRDGLSNDERTSRLYSLMQTRTNGFHLLSQALVADHQTGAYRILQRAMVSHNGRRLSEELSSIVLFSSILPAIRKELLDDDNVNILIVSTPDPLLSRKRVEDVVVDYVVVYDEKTSWLSKAKLENLDTDKVHVIPCGGDNVEVMLKRLGDSGAVANVVLLTSQSVEELEGLTETQNCNVKIVEDEITWIDLTEKGQQIVLQEKVMFQGQEIRLDEIPREILPLEEIRGRIIFDLLDEMIPELVKNSVEPSPNYYVPRKIATRVILSSKVFQNAGKDVFVVDGIELHQPSNLTSKGNNGEVARSSEQAVAKSLTAQFIQLEHDMDYDDICKLSKNPVHLISYRMGKITWRKSYNSLGVIQKYIEEETQEQNDMAEDIFVERCLKSQSPICIADSPGMGKTLLLTRIAEKVMMMMSESSASEKIVVVRFLVLRDLIPALQNQEIDTNFFCELISKPSSDYQLGRQIVIKALKSEKVPCHLFIDGYDELLFSELGIANKLLKCLTTELKNTQLYVTTRLCRCGELEEALITIGYHIKPFDQEDQEAFLSRYWSSEAGAAATTSDGKLKEFAKSCLSRLQKSMNKAERDIAGIPLQCRLLADVYSKQAKRVSEGRDRGEPTLEVVDSSLSSLFGMYKIFMQQSFGKVVEGFAKERVRRAHMYYAINLIFRKIGTEFKMAILKENFCDPQDPILLAPGILEKFEHEEGPRFVHRTLAEYLIAQFVIDLLEINEQRNFLEDTVLGLVLSTMLSTSRMEDTVLRESPFLLFDHVSIVSQAFDHPVICYFLNSLLQEKSNVQLETVPMACSLNTIPTLELDCIFIATVASNFTPLASYLANLSNFYAADLPWSDLLLLTAKHGGTQLLSQLPAIIAKQQQTQISEINYPGTKINDWNWEIYENQLVITPLHVAVHWGNHHVAIALANKFGFRDLVLAGANQRVQYLLHFCVMESNKDDEQVWKDKIEIINWLCSEERKCSADQKPNPFRHVLEEKFPNGITPLLQPRVHPSLIQTLIQVGADINAVNERKECLLHTAMEGCTTPTQFHEVVESLADRDFRHYDIESSMYGSPLRRAIQIFDIEMRTVALLQKNKVDINQTKFGKSILFDALCRRRSKGFVHELAAQGAILKEERNNRTSMIPAKVMEAVEYVVEKTTSYDDEILGSSSSCIINAKLDLEEMGNHSFFPYVFSLTNNAVFPVQSAEYYFLVHCLTSEVIGRKSMSVVEEEDGWTLAFNFDEIQENGVMDDIEECTAKVVLFHQELVGEIEKVFEATGKYPIVAVEKFQSMDQN